MKPRKNPSTAELASSGSVPTIVFTKTCGFEIRNAYIPKARSRTIASSLSRNRIGSIVPHFWFTNVFRFAKQTSARKGLFPPSGSESAFVSSGMFSVESVWRPAPKVSSARPSRKKIAA